MASCPDECPNLSLFLAKLMFMSLNREQSCFFHRRGKFVISQLANSFGPGFTILLLNNEAWGRGLDRTRGKYHSCLFRQLHFCEAQSLSCALNVPIGSGPLADKERDFYGSCWNLGRRLEAQCLHSFYAQHAQKQNSGTKMEVSASEGYVSNLLMGKCRPL